MEESAYGINGFVYVLFFDENGACQGKIETDSNVPHNHNESLVSGVEKDFLFYDQIGVYEYDCSTQSYETVLN